MADRIAHRELRNRSGEVLRAVADGATYEITNHGEVVAILTPVGVDRRLRSRAPRVRRGFSELKRVRRGESISVILDDLRAER